MISVTQLEQAIAAGYGKTIESVFLDVTGLPMWAVEAGPEASRARAAWKRFLKKVAAANNLNVDF